MIEGVAALEIDHSQFSLLLALLLRDLELSLLDVVLGDSLNREEFLSWVACLLRIEPRRLVSGACNRFLPSSSGFSVWFFFGLHLGSLLCSC